MATIKYALERGGPKRLEISYKGNWKDFTIRLDGNVIGTMTDVEQLKAGQEFTLDDGSTLKVQYKFPAIRLSRDGQPLLLYDPVQHLSYAYKIIFFFGAMNLVFGIFGTFLNTTVENLPTGGVLSIAFGILFLVLGFLIMRRSIIALSIAAGILAIDMVIAIFFPPNLPQFALIIGLAFRMLILLVMLRGFFAVKALKQTTPNKSVS
jgi:hypothetical protein